MFINSSTHLEVLHLELLEHLRLCIRVLLILRILNFRHFARLGTLLWFYVVLHVLLVTARERLEPLWHGTVDEVCQGSLNFHSLGALGLGFRGFNLGGLERNRLFLGGHRVLLP
jgi:hypothetical protein